MCKTESLKRVGIPLAGGEQYVTDVEETITIITVTQTSKRPTLEREASSAMMAEWVLKSKELKKPRLTLRTTGRTELYCHRVKAVAQLDCFRWVLCWESCREWSPSILLPPGRVFFFFAPEILFALRGTCTPKSRRILSAFARYFHFFPLPLFVSSKFLAFIYFFFSFGSISFSLRSILISRLPSKCLPCNRQTTRDSASSIGLHRTLSAQKDKTKANEIHWGCLQQRDWTGKHPSITKKPSADCRNVQWLLDNLRRFRCRVTKHILGRRRKKSKGERERERKKKDMDKFFFFFKCHASHVGYFKKKKEKRKKKKKKKRRRRRRFVS